MIRSRTSQNVLAGGVITLAGLLSLFKGVRSIFPDLMWAEDADETVASFAMIIVIPYLSRKLAFLRNKEKKK